MRRLKITPDEAGNVMITHEISNNRDKQWLEVTSLSLTKRERSDNFMPVRDDFGIGDPDRIQEAKQFDFLVGEYSADHTFINPQGEKSEFKDTTATAVYICNGTAIMEFLWDYTNAKPDSAISVMRAYNQAQRRWESLFMSNGSNGQLHFGGVKEGDRIILHPFEVNATGQMSMWVFHDIREGAYDWFGQNSNDRGKTWQQNWIIHITSRP